MLGTAQTDSFGAEGPCKLHVSRFIRIDSYMEFGNLFPDNIDKIKQAGLFWIGFDEVGLSEKNGGVPVMRNIQGYQLTFRKLHIPYDSLAFPLEFQIQINQ